MPPQQEMMATMNMPSEMHMRQGQDHSNGCYKEDKWHCGINCYSRVCILCLFHFACLSVTTCSCCFAMVVAATKFQKVNDVNAFVVINVDEN